MYVVTIVLPDGCAHRIDECGPAVYWLAVSDGHEHPDDPDAYAIYDRVARAFLDAIRAARPDVPPG
jgi:hypothetical protein